MVRRTSEHETKFFKEFGVNIELICFSIIEAQYIFDAEKSVRKFFVNDGFEYTGFKELVKINKRLLGQTRQHFTMIQNSYIGRFKEMNERIISLEKEITALQHKLVLKDKDLELKDKTLELKDKDLEIEKLKNEAMTYKLKFMENIKSK